MVNYSCPKCEKEFSQKGHYERHLARKLPCKKPSVEKQVNQELQKTDLGLFYVRPYANVKEYVDNTLNKDTTLSTSSNDEPTPIGCLEEMFSKVPVAVWQQKDMKILDPCCGNGNFGVVVGERLRTNGYSTTDIQKALHFNDTNQARLANVKSIFGSLANITSIDFLRQDYGELYDMIVMNPPYAKLMDDGSRASKNHSVFVSFMEKGLRILKPNGILVAIIPDSWMSLSDRNTFCKEITQYQFHCLNIHSAKRWFPKVGSSFTWFVLQKTPHFQPFEVSGVWKKTPYTCRVESQVRSFIPLLYSSHVQQVFLKTVESNLPKYRVETSSHLHKYTQREYIQAEQSPEFCHRLIHTPKQTVWANRPHKFQDGWKVFLSTTDKYAAFVDSCGMTQSIAFIRVDTQEEAKAIAKKLEHPLYMFLNNICRYGNFNNIRILQKFPVSTTDNPYTEFGITEDEIAYIESHL